MVSSSPPPAACLPACRYSEEELKALHEQPDEGEQGGAAGPPVAQPAAAAPPAAVDPAAFKRQLLGLIPKDKAGVFAFQINWAVLDAAPPEVKDKISGEQGGSGVGGSSRHLGWPLGAGGFLTALPTQSSLAPYLVPLPLLQAG